MLQLAQTLADITIIDSLMDKEELLKPPLFNAKAEGVMCPALLELVCKTLESSGAGKHLQPCQMPSAVVVVQQCVHAPLVLVHGGTAHVRAAV